MSKFDPAFIEEVRSKNDIVEVVSEYVSLEKKGHRYWGLCPFHAEKTPSFSVIPDKQFFYCFGCQAGGNVIGFIQKKDNLSFVEAVKALAKRARIPIPAEKRTPEEEKAYQERERVQEALELASRYFHHLLFNTPGGAKALEYLRRRGLTEDTIRRFQLGYSSPAWDDLCRGFLKKGHTAEVLLKAGLIIQRESKDGYYDRFRDRVMFPITDLRGRVIGFGGRTMGDGQPKYLNSPETPFFSKGKNLYGLSQAKEAIRSKDQAIIVEGYMDAVTAHQAGFTNVVASLGTALTADQARLLRLQTPNVVIAYDADAAGQKATLRGLDILVAAGCQVRVLRPSEGKDPDEFIRSSGPAAFARAIDEAPPLLDFKFELARSKFRGKTPEDRVAVISEILPILAGIQDSVLQDAYLKRLSGEVEVTEEALRIELGRFKRRQASNGALGHTDRRIWNNTRDSAITKDLPEDGKAGSGHRIRPAGDARLRAEESLVSVILQRAELVGPVMQALGPAGFSDPLYSQIAGAIARLPNARGTVQSGQIMDDLDAEAVRVLAHLEAEGRPIGDPDRVIADCINTIREHRMKERYAELIRVAEALQAEGKPVDRQIALELIELQRRIDAIKR